MKLWGMISSPRYSPTDEEFYLGFNCLIYDYNDSDRDEFEWERWRKMLFSLILLPSILLLFILSFRFIKSFEKTKQEK